MLVYLAEYLTQFYTGFNVFSYLTFRAILGLLTALSFALWWGPKLIERLQVLQIGQVVRNDGPESHFSKRGTPTMGGLLVLAGIFISVLLWGDLGNRYVWVMLFVLGSFGLIGFLDDYRKVVRKDPKGLVARWKYILQSLAAIAVAFYLYATAALAGGIGAVVTRTLTGSEILALPVCLILTLALRAGSIRYGWRLPAFRPRARRD